MTTTLPWLLAGAGLLLLPARSRGDPVVRTGRAASRRALPGVAALAVGAAVFASFGGLVGASAAIVVAPLIAVVVGRLDTRARRSAPDRRLALALDLAAAVLRCGHPVATALDRAAPVADESSAARLGQVAGLLRLGADPVAAWSLVGDDDVLGPVAQVAARSADSGVRLARGLEQAADELRRELRAAAEVRAHRVGVLAMLPLGLCFLPAFVCLGVVPVVVGIGHGAFSGVP